MAGMILSRIVAIAILAIPVGFVLQEIDDRDWRTIQKYSHAELLAYISSQYACHPIW